MYIFRDTCLPVGRAQLVEVMYYVYILKSEQGNHYYTGLTNNLKRRLFEHNSGYTKSTKAYIPYKIVYKEIFSTRTEARVREKFLKSGVGREFRNKILYENIPR